MKNKNLEEKTLLVGAGITLIMALSGWWIFYVTGSQAVMLDGHFSFISFLGILIAIKIAAIKDVRTADMPQGRFIYESLYAFSVGLLLVVLLVFAFVQNFFKIIQYIQGEVFEPLQGGLIFIYAMIMMLLCFGITLYYRHQNKKINNSSLILETDASKSVIDGVLSGAIGVVLGAIGFVNIEGSLGFLHFIGDSILVLVLCALFWSMPANMLRSSFREIIGIATDDVEVESHMRSIVDKHLPEDSISDIFVSKLGSSYFVYVVASAKLIDNISAHEFLNIKQVIRADLKVAYEHVLFDILLE